MTDKSYLSYFTSITHKIHSNKKKYTDRCWKTAMTMMLYFQKKYKLDLKKYIISTDAEMDYFMDHILNPNPRILLDVEYHTESENQFIPKQKSHLMSKYQIQMIPGTFVAFA